MTFTNPLALLLLLPISAAATASLIYSGRLRVALPFPKGILLDRIALHGPPAILKYVPYALTFLASILLVLGLARPQKVLYQANLEKYGVDILLAIDTSESMRGLDFQPLNRLEAAKINAKEFIRNRIHDRIGIVVFAAHAFLQCPLTLDYESLLEFLDVVEIGMTHSDGTAVGDAIATGINHLKTSHAKTKVLILLTDGRSNTGYISDPLLAAKTAQSFGIKIYTIGTATKGLAPYPVQDPLLGTRIVQLPEDLDEESLTQIAQTTGGQFFRATNTQELKKIYTQINHMEKTHAKIPETASREDMALYFLIPALLLLLMESMLSSTYLLRIP
ncbi:MAG: VWA domain-containing protein [Elusimicrobia bacterium]|nr:VWA domain-containing protein [Elusimicrobiota bacterium]